MFLSESYQIYKEEKVITRPKNPKRKSPESDFHLSNAAFDTTEIESDE